MRAIIIPADEKVIINGESYTGIDLSSIDPSINAVQWYETDGEVEIKDARGRIIENRQIDSFDEFAFVIPLWETAKIKFLEDNKPEPIEEPQPELLNTPTPEVINEPQTPTP